MDTVISVELSWALAGTPEFSQRRRSALFWLLRKRVWSVSTLSLLGSAPAPCSASLRTDLVPVPSNKKLVSHFQPTREPLLSLHSCLSSSAAHPTREVSIWTSWPSSSSLAHLEHRHHERSGLHRKIQTGVIRKVRRVPQRVRYVTSHPSPCFPIASHPMYSLRDSPLRYSSSTGLLFSRTVSVDTQVSRNETGQVTLITSRVK